MQPLPDFGDCSREDDSIPARIHVCYLRDVGLRPGREET